MHVLSHQRIVPLTEVAGPRCAGIRTTRFRTPVSGASRAPESSRQQVGGFTLVELMITLAIAVVLITIAVPSFKNITLTNKLTTTANDVVAALNIAKMEAIKANTSVQFCGSASNGSSTLGTACGTQTGAVYALINGTAVQIRAGVTSIASPITLNGNMAAVRFSGQGLGYGVSGSTLFGGSVADITTSSMSSDNHRCITLTTGSIIETTTTSQACP